MICLTVYVGVSIAGGTFFSCIFEKDEVATNINY